MSLPQRYKAGASPGHPSFSPAAGPSFCIVYIASWMGHFLICNVLLSGGRGNGMNWTDCELAKRCSTLPHLWVSVWHQIGSHASQGNRGEERCHLDPPCQQWPSEGSFGALAYFPERVAVAPWGPELLWPPLASVFPKVPWTRLHGDSWVQIREERGGQ